MCFPHNGHAAGRVGVQGAEEFAGGCGVGSETKVFSLSPEAADRGGFGIGEGAEYADAGVGHGGAGAPAGEEGYFGVIVHHRQPWFDDEFEEPIGGLLDLLAGEVQGDGVPTGSTGLEKFPHRGQMGNGGVESACVVGGLGFLVGEAGPRAHDGPGYGVVGPGAGGVKVDGPQDSGAGGVGEETGLVFGQRWRVQADGLVGKINALAAAERFGVEGATGGDEGRGVGDGVVHTIAFVVKHGDAHGLVEIHGSGRVDGDKRNMGGVDAAGGMLVGGGGGVGKHIGRKGGVEPEFVDDCGEIEVGRIEFHSLRLCQFARRRDTRLAHPKVGRN